MAEFADDVSSSSSLECTRSFWKSFVGGEMQNIEDLISPDCRIQDSFQSGRGSLFNQTQWLEQVNNYTGINGIRAVMEKLTELQTKLSSNGLLKNGMQDLRVMRNQTQCRFLVRGKVGFMKIVIGFAVEWQYNIITGFVLVKNASLEEFMRDSTSAPEPIAVQKGEEIDEDEDELDETAADTSASSPQETDMDIASPDAIMTGNKREGWYPGKYWHEAKPFKRKPKTHAVKDIHEGVPPVSVSSGILGKLKDLHPPYLCPKPPKMNAVVSVTVLGCTNLKSRLVRLRERPVSAYVRVDVGSKSRCTSVAKKTGNPIYDETDTFLFTLSDSMRNHGGFLRFHVFDKNTLQDDILATKVVSLASLKCQVDDEDIPELVYPLVHNERRAPLGKGLKGSILSDACTLRVRIAKIDLEEWWVLEELRLRDKVTEERIAREKEEARARKAEELARVLTETSQEWESDESVIGCRKCETEFSITNRKHHCRVCGLVVCGKCSSHRVVMKNGDTVRACNDCFSKKSSRCQSSTENSGVPSINYPSNKITSSFSHTIADETVAHPTAAAEIALNCPSHLHTSTTNTNPTTQLVMHDASSNRLPDSDDDDDDVDNAIAAVGKKLHVEESSQGPLAEREDDAKGQRHVYDGTDTDDEDDEACVIS